MQLRQTTLALPADTRADISPEWDDAEAGNLLALWTALWHPALIAHTRRLPDTVAVDTLVESDLDPGTLVLVPEIAHSQALSDWHTDHPLIVRLPTFDRRSKVISHLATVLPVDLSASVEMVADLHALGFAYLQIELLTRSMQYDRQVTQESLRAAVVAAADAALAGDEPALSTHLQDAYDQLMQSRNHYYPIDFYLIDLALTAPSVVSDTFAKECRTASNSNVLVTGELLAEMAAEHPDSLAALREAVGEGRIGLCGGTMSDTPLAALSPEALLAELRGGVTAAEEHLGQRLQVFAHREGPLAPLVPGVLYKLGYHAAVLTNFVGDRLPSTSTSGSRTTWTGLDNTPIESLAAEPIDAGSNSAMLALSQKMQHTMNYDLAASLLLAGWPGHRTEWHGDLMRVAQRSSILGRPISLTEYFDVTSSHDYAGSMAADVYRLPPGEARTERRESSDAFSALCQIAGAASTSPVAVANLLGTNGEETSDGTLWINASSLLRSRGKGELPPFGWRWEPASDVADRPPRCEEGTLRNEHMEVVFDAISGGISATRLHERRGNFLSQHLVITAADPRSIAAGLQLAHDGWEVAESSNDRGTLATNYRVVDRDGKTVGDLRQRTSLGENSHALQVEVEYEPRGDRTLSCLVASRIAVREQDFPLTRGLQGVDLPTSKSRFTAEWLGIAGEPVPIAVVCDAPRQHRRHSGRMLDTTLVEAAGQTISTGLSYVLECRYPAQVAAMMRDTGAVVSLPHAGVTQPSGWWLHLGAASVRVTHLSAEPLKGDLIVRMRLLETAGRTVATTLSAWKPIVEAQQLNFLDEPDQMLAIADGILQIHLAPYEFLELQFALGS